MISYIVTGGSGFIGSNIVSALNLNGNDDILVVDRADGPSAAANLGRLRYGSFMDKDEFRDALRQSGSSLDRDVRGLKAVIHMGACTSTTETDEKYLRDNNYAYTRELCEWCLEHAVRFVYASSAATYGDGSRGYSDNHAAISGLRPLNAYGRSKQMFDEWALETGIQDRIAGLKYFNVYGPGEDHKGEMRSVVNKAFAQVKDTGVIRLFKSYRNEYRHGEQDRDFIYVADAVDVTLFFCSAGAPSGIYNCGTGEPRTWKDLAQAVFSAMDRPPRIEFVEMPEAIRENYQYHTRADTRKLRSAGYRKRFTPLEDGVREYVRDYLCLSAGGGNRDS
ncbi:MAG: ADP-glyceromanno-heptose 6-epimerase [Kiritimatiellia bacterium]